jgi:AcrR family transcriptional regulator
MLADANSAASVSSVRQRLSSTERREAIVTAAMDLFAQRGFRGTTTRELAAQVGVSEPVLYQHFPSKSDLYTAMVDRMVSDLAKGAEDYESRFDESVDETVYFQWLGEKILELYIDGSRFVRLLLYSALEGHELAELWHKRATQHFGCVVEKYLTARAKRQGYYVEDVRLTARAFISMVAHFGLIWGIFNPQEFNYDRKEVVRQFVGIYVNGIRHQAAPGGQ